MNTSDRDSEIRACGIAESLFFDYLDGTLPAAQLEEFEAHCAGCPACQQDVVAYHELELALDELPAPLPREGFDQAVLEAVLGAPVPVAAAVPTRRPSGLPAAAGWRRRVLGGLPLNLGRRAPVYALGLGVVAVAVMIALSFFAGSVGGWGALAALTVSRVVRFGVDALGHGIADLLAAVRASDVLLGVASVLRPVWRSMSLAARTVGPEFWFVSTLVSLLALMGAVRLAAGAAVEKGVRRVSLLF
jgi:anti-sigma factor RsiW